MRLSRGALYVTGVLALLNLSIGAADISVGKWEAASTQVLITIAVILWFIACKLELG